MRKTGVAFAAAALLLGLTVEATAATPHPAYSQIASELAGQTTVVECHTVQEWGASRSNGRALWGGNLIQLAPWTCAALNAYPSGLGSVLCARSRSDWSLVWCRGFPQAAQAARTLAHEALHIAGVFSETDADCQSFRYLRATVVRLGAPLYADWVYQAERGRWEAERLPGYYTADCPNYPA